MSALLTILLLMSPASNAGDLDASYVCKVFDKSGASRDIPVRISLKSYQLRKIEFTVHGKTQVEEFEKDRVAGNRVSLYVPLPQKDPRISAWTRSLVYNFDFHSSRFGEGLLNITQIVEPRPNVVTSRSIQATGICTIIIPGGAS